MGNGVEDILSPEQVNESQEQGMICNMVEDIGIQEDIDGRCRKPCSNVEGTHVATNDHDVEVGNAFSASENLPTLGKRKHIEIDCIKDCESPIANSAGIEEKTDISLSNVYDRIQSTFENPPLETHCRKNRRICESSAGCLSSINDETRTLFPVTRDNVRNTSEKHSGEELLHCKQLDSEVQNVGVIPNDETDDICKTSFLGEPVEKQRQLIMEEIVPTASAKDDITPANMDITILPQERPMPIDSNKKLLVLDVNGLLADIVFLEGPCARTPDTIISSKAVFMRPFYKDFLDFCFTHFNVGIWTSRTKRNVEMILNFLLGESKIRISFSFVGGIATVEDKNKPLITKKLKKLWEKDDPKLPWEKGQFNESNTLLLDDTPHKALCNPPHTAIFPESYRYTDVNDNSLSPEGELRAYLKGLAEAENVPKYVKKNPFGQRPITEKNLSWRYYERVIAACSSSSKANCNRYDWKASSEAAPSNRQASYNRRDNNPSSYSDATPRIYENYNRNPDHSSFGLEATRFRHGSDHHSSYSEAAHYRKGSDQWKAKNTSFPQASSYWHGSSSFPKAAPYRHGGDYRKAVSAAAPDKRPSFYADAYSPAPNLSSPPEANAFICGGRSYQWKDTHSNPSTEATPDRHGGRSYPRTSPRFTSYREAIPDRRRRTNTWTSNQAPSSSEASSDRCGSYQ